MVKFWINWKVEQIGFPEGLDIGDREREASRMASGFSEGKVGRTELWLTDSRKSIIEVDLWENIRHSF